MFSNALQNLSGIGNLMLGELFQTKLWKIIEVVSNGLCTIIPWQKVNLSLYPFPKQKFPILA